MENLKTTKITLLLVVAAFFLAITGCADVKYAALEKIGKEKRHILVDNVEEVKESQIKAQEEFTDALTRIKELYAFDGGDLEKFYNRYKASYEECDERASQIEKRIKDVKAVAKDLFKEWEEEIKEIKSANVKARSQKRLRETKTRYSKLENVMVASTAKMYPVLTKLNDYRITLKHDLNAKAIGSLSGEAIAIEKEVASLIKDMTTSIDEAQRFIKNFQQH